MHFIVDAQLSPRLAQWLRERGHRAEHVRELSLASGADAQIAVAAEAARATVITKDVDFSHLMLGKPAIKVVWIRFGNASSAELIRSLEPVWPDIEAALASGQRLVEVSR